MVKTRRRSGGKRRRRGGGKNLDGSDDSSMYLDREDYKKSSAEETAKAEGEDLPKYADFSRSHGAALKTTSNEMSDFCRGKVTDYMTNMNADESKAKKMVSKHYPKDCGGILSTQEGGRRRRRHTKRHGKKSKKSKRRKSSKRRRKTRRY